MGEEIKIGETSLNNSLMNQEQVNAFLEAGRILQKVFDVVEIRVYSEDGTMIRDDQYAFWIKVNRVKKENIETHL